MRIRRDATGPSPVVGWATVGLFALGVALLGGSSRPDAIQLVALRPLAALFLIPALYLASFARLSSARGLVMLLLALAGWMIVQIVPLPPFLWQSLPGRDPIVALDAAAGLDGVWRPISLVPIRTMNALASLLVPLAGLLLVLVFRIRARVILLFLAGLGVLDALLGILQTAGGSGEALYFYAITNKGTPVGIFANQNHSAVFSACMMLVFARLATEPAPWREPRALRIAYGAGFLLVTLAALSSGSRAGLLTAVFALAVSTVMLWLSLHRGKPTDKGGALASRLAASPGLIGGAALLSGVALIALFYAYDSLPALGGLTESDSFEDLRFAILPSLRELMGTYWLVGSGFGSFEEVYHIVEPDSLLAQWYVNQAHNDWAQLVISGGVPAIAILLALGVWIVRSLLKIMRAERPQPARLLFWFATLVIIAAASLADYPLRTPVFQLAAVWLLAALALDRTETR